MFLRNAVTSLVRLQTVIIYKTTVYAHLFVKMADYLGRLLQGLTCFSKRMSYEVVHLRQASRQASTYDSCCNNMTSDSCTKYQAPQTSSVVQISLEIHSSSRQCLIKNQDITEVIFFLMVNNAPPYSRSASKILIENATGKSDKFYS